MASEMAGLHWAMALEMASVRSEMVTQMESDLEKASGTPSEKKLIGHVCFEDIHIV
jgi:hypothetical protein